MLELLICAAMIILLAWPETSVGKLLHCMLVLRPAQKLSQIRMAHVAFILLLAVVTVAAIAFARTDGPFLVAQGAEGLAWFATVDIATYVDVAVLALVSVASGVVSWVLKAGSRGLARLRRAVVRPSRPSAARRRRPKRLAPPPANDDDPAGIDWATAA
ncbi:MAG TPA: hypothetical protein VGH86_03220 [Phenylobacterium sp.]|jgi:hypothetical protein